MSGTLARLAGPLALAALLAAGPSPAAIARHLAFERAGGIWLADLDGTHARRVATGELPAISPDGTRIAYTTNEPGRPGPVRHIAVLTLATGKVWLIRSAPSDNAFGPAWSPDGRSLLFDVHTGGTWRLACVNADDTHLRLVAPTPVARDTWESCWAADGASFYCHDLDSIYCRSASGMRVAAWGIAALAPRGGFNSGSRLSASPDGRSLLVELDMDEPDALPGWDGPPVSLWRLDLASGRMRRLTPVAHYVWSGTWVDDSSYVCQWQRKGENEPSLWRMRVDGAAPVRLARNARTPSVSR